MESSVRGSGSFSPGRVGFAGEGLLEVGAGGGGLAFFRVGAGEVVVEERVAGVAGDGGFVHGAALPDVTGDAVAHGELIGEEAPQVALVVVGRLGGRIERSRVVDGRGGVVMHVAVIHRSHGAVLHDAGLMVGIEAKAGQVRLPGCHIEFVGR
jgi:hypothetical protein